MSSGAKIYDFERAKNNRGGGDGDEPDAAIWVATRAWDEASIPERPWIARGYLLRGAVTIAAGMGSAGKSLYTCGQACSLALQQEFGDFKPLFPARVAIFNV